MAIKSNLKSMQPRRQAYKREITLLSHGYVNKTAWPDGRLTVFPWDNTTDQWLLDNARRLNRQELVNGLLKQCCDLNGGRIEDFLSDELMVVLLVSRALSTDGIITYQAICPYCGFKTVETIKVPDSLEKIGEKTAEYPGFDSITLANCKDEVKVRPLLIKDDMVILSRPDDERKLVSDSELRTLLRVVTINDTKPDTLAELTTWFRALHPGDAKYLEEQARALSPHLNTEISHRCDDPQCNRTFKHPLAFTTEFFR